MKDAPVSLKIEKLAHCQGMPQYASGGAAGLDLCLASDKPVEIKAGHRDMLPTGIKVEIPQGYEGQVRPRSGLAAKHGISLTNCIGTVDSDYRGEVMVLIINHGQEAYTFQPGDRIAQLVITPVITVSIEEVESVSTTARGEGGFGSTGKNLLTV
ncbi:dUTP diphosphatase [bacterium]|nr:dUTP diphosphatase [bacterium]QQR58071.1 MAG: dUTP diphosphatase [Candidatus Melainabacteria bacterium]